jgi:hypothetical protein
MTNGAYLKLRQCVKDVYYLVKGYTWKKIRPVFILSTGRTGTKFFAGFFSSGFNHVYAVHEPSPDMLELGLSVVRGEISFRRARKELRLSRQNICKQVNKKNYSYYIESNNNISFIVPLLKDYFKNCKIIHVVRDGRNFVRSSYSKVIFPPRDGKPAMLFMTPGDHRRRLQAVDFPDDPYHYRWKEMTRFERICWYWVKVNSIIEYSIKGDKNSIRVKYEDIFSEDSGIETISNIIEFLDLTDKMSFNKDEMKKFFEKKVNYTEKFLLPQWSEWTSQQRDFFIEIAGRKMEEYGYDLDG